MKTIFITGGAGYVGSALVPSLLRKGYRVIVYDWYIYGNVFKGLNNPNLIEIKGDIRDTEALRRASEGADAFIHLACISNDPSFELDPALGKSINYDAFFGIVESVEKNSIPRFVYASSASIYGVQEREVTEDREPHPITDYGKYKLECEKVLRDTKLFHVSVRPGTVCGYAPRLRLDLTINLLTMHALVNKKITVFGGMQLRPHINIKDMVRIYELLLEAPEKKIKGEAFNTGFWNISVLDTAKMIIDILGDSSVGLEVTGTNDPRSYKLNADKIKNMLGFEPQFDLKDAVLSVKDAYDRGLIVDGLTNPLFHNVKRMQEIKLV